MDLTLRRLDAERYRRRLRLLAELAEAKTGRDTRSREAKSGRLRQLVTQRRRLVG